MSPHAWLGLAAFTLACGSPQRIPAPEAPASIDRDGDGAPAGPDCDDQNPDVAPGRAESCDHLDNNCDGRVDEGVLEAWAPDGDGDGFKQPDAAEVLHCDALEGHLPARADADCDDADPLTHPGAPERCDGRDNDCDGATDPTACRPLSAADARLRGDSARQRVGHALSGALDSDGDGAPEIALGLPGDAAAGSDAGRILVVALPFAADARPADARVSIGGAALGGRLGQALVAAGDVDGDGFDDLWAGVPGDTAGGVDAGAALLWRGPLQGAAPGGAHARLVGGEIGGQVGLSVAGGADLDGDGLPDLLAAAPSLETPAVALISGTSSGTQRFADAAARLTGGGPEGLFGRAMAAGDLDGDGFGDVIIAEQGHDAGRGRVLVWAGPLAGPYGAASADGAWSGTAPRAGLGGALALIGDADGDGLPDLAVGAPDDDTAGVGAGAVVLLAGPAFGVGPAEGLSRVLGRLAGDHAGTAVAGAGDRDGDGAPDILIGASVEDSAGLNAGAAFLVTTPTSGTLYLNTAGVGLLGEAEGDQAGWSVSAVPDIDGDALPDLLVGAPFQDATGQEDAGALYLLGTTGL